MNREEFKDLALQKGFLLKEQPDGTMDLDPCVYEFAKSLLLQGYLVGVIKGAINKDSLEAEEFYTAGENFSNRIME